MVKSPSLTVRRLSICLLPPGAKLTGARYSAPINLFRRAGLFQSMCERSGISEQDVLRGSAF